MYGQRDSYTGIQGEEIETEREKEEIEHLKSICLHLLPNNKYFRWLMEGVLDVSFHPAITPTITQFIAGLSHSMVLYCAGFSLFLVPFYSRTCFSG